MVRNFLRRGLLVLWLVLGLQAVAWAQAPAIILTAFGTTTNAFSTYQSIENQVKERFPGYEIRWAYTSKMVRHKVQAEQHKELKSLPEALQELKAAGFTKIVVQSLLLAPGKEWEGIVKQSRGVPGLTVALGKPLLSNNADMVGTIKALAQEFPADLQENAVVLVGHGSPDPKGQATNNTFAQLLRRRYPEHVFFGLVEFQKPGKEEVLREVKQSGVTSVVFVPFLLVAGDHVQNDILGNGPDSWKSALLKMGNYRVEGISKGLGYLKEIVNIYLDHLEAALKELQD
ncbi:MAG: sirohydrochlorin cobaltochelatase [Desulfobaccales bacterium]